MLVQIDQTFIDICDGRNVVDHQARGTCLILAAMPEEFVSDLWEFEDEYDFEESNSLALSS